MTAADTTVHPTAVVGPGVTLGQGVQIGPYAVLLGPLRVGDRVWIGSGTSIGAPPEITDVRHNLAWAGDLGHAGVVIEDDAVIRELVVIHQGSRRPTTVGAGSWLLNRCYLAHDVQTGPGVTVSAGGSIGGHATIRGGATLRDERCRPPGPSDRRPGHDRDGRRSLGMCHRSARHSACRCVCRGSTRSGCAELG
ncbi:MAG: hypothetical protein IPJ15_11095 [Actinomycetales bacterium]|nr:hypothetical protein [Candidatus Phosphoribacter baldrii]